MRIRFILSRSLVLFLALIWLPAYTAVLIDTTENPTPTVQGYEAQEEPAQELFPLNEVAEINAPPVRTEQPSLQTLEEWHDLRAKILNDFGSRIFADFHIQDGLRQRTEFWFDIYTRYGEAHHIIHHVLYPWIVFKVVDTTEMLIHGKGPPWLRHDRANKLAQAQTAQVRLALKRLALRSDYTHLSPIEKELYDKLMPVKGPRRAVFRMAAANVRSQLGQKDFFERGLVNSSRYLPYMEEEFKRLGLPTELTRMPFVESSFNEEARSKVGASGIWQIMPRTGQQYMIVTPQIDERNSPLKATRTAGRLLHSYNHALGSWPLTITSYNHGIGNIQKAIRMANSRDLAQIIQRYHDGDFKFASSNFYTCFLAALYAEKYNELVFKDSPREPLQEQEVLKLTGTTRIRDLKRVTGLAPKELLRFNLDLKSAIQSNSALPRGFQLHLPPGLRERLIRQMSAQNKKSRTRT